MRSVLPYFDEIIRAVSLSPLFRPPPPPPSMFLSSDSKALKTSGETLRDIGQMHTELVSKSAPFLSKLSVNCMSTIVNHVLNMEWGSKTSIFSKNGNFLHSWAVSSIFSNTSILSTLYTVTHMSAQCYDIL